MVMGKGNTPTSHIGAKYGEIAETVIMSGDPLRAKFIAENFLQEPVLYNQIRGMYGYTGLYKGKRVSVQGHGMGIPSIGIYTYELFNNYDVQQIIRVGTAGALVPVDLAAVSFANAIFFTVMVFAMGACTDSNYGHQFSIPGHFAPIADYGLLENAVRVARENSFSFKVGNVYSADVFYDESEKQMLWGEKMGVLAVEMETTALYVNAAAAGRKALTICTISDQLVTKEFASVEERQTKFRNMMKVALEIA